MVYGSVAGLPAFTLAVLGFSLLVGVITDRSRSLWPSIVAHGAWNGLVATSFAVTQGADAVPAFAGDDRLLGEFGWLAATAMLALGAAATWWHLAHGGGGPEGSAHPLD
ncbi:MAG: CPBP family intramembrane glutamic endopeptidase [Ornithinibacter sp.]